jgi:hypothetical protein
LREVFKPVARFNNLAVDAFGLLGEGVASACRFFVNALFELVECVLFEAFDAEFNSAQLFFECDEAGGEVFRFFVRVCGGAEEL